MTPPSCECPALLGISTHHSGTTPIMSRLWKCTNVTSYVVFDRVRRLERTQRRVLFWRSLLRLMRGKVGLRSGSLSNPYRFLWHHQMLMAPYTEMGACTFLKTFRHPFLLSVVTLLARLQRVSSISLLCPDMPRDNESDCLLLYAAPSLPTAAFAKLSICKKAIDASFVYHVGPL